MPFVAVRASSYQQSITVSRAELLKAARTLLKYTTENRHLLAYRYNGSFRSRAAGKRETVRQWARTSALLGLPGLKIDGRTHALWVGDGQCFLEPQARRGKGRGTERIDVRERKAIETDNFGIVKITRKKRKFGLPEELAKCIAFLESVPDRKVTLFSFDTPPTVGDLIDDFGEDEERDKWVLEEIARDSHRWKGELLAALKEERYRYHRATIVTLLVLSFREEKTRTALVKAIDALPKKNRTELHTLVAELETAERRR